MRCKVEAVLVQPEQWCGVWKDGDGRTQNSCGEGRLCVLFDNPNCGLSSFDHLPASFLVLFQVSALCLLRICLPAPFLLLLLSFSSLAAFFCSLLAPRDSEGGV